MSVQRLTNRRRILAEVGNTKVQYPRISLNNNPLYATSTCTPNFRQLTYARQPCCEKKSFCYNLTAMHGGFPGFKPTYFVT